MARAPRKPKTTATEVVEAYQYGADEATRKNNPEAGLATYEKSIRETTQYAYDPHLDPQLVWAGKAERDEAGLTVDTVSLHIHERVSTPQIIRQARREEPKQLDLFADPHLPLGEAIEFYQHDVNWSNRLVLGDSLLVLNSLLEREGMAGKVQMIYIDPPYGVSYNSNFQPAINRRDSRDADDSSLTREPEMIKAYRDTWRLGIHSYLSYLRDRLKLARELLADSGALFVQIGEENLHHVREILDETFGVENFVSVITFAKTAGSTGEYLSSTADFLLLYARDRDQLKYHALYAEKSGAADETGPYSWLELAGGERRRMTPAERQDPSLVPAGSRRFRIDNLQSQSIGRKKGEGAASWFPVELNGQEWRPSTRSRWKTNEEGMQRLKEARRLAATSGGLYYVRYLDDFPLQPHTNSWPDTGIAGFASQKSYVVETSTKVIARCLLMTTDAGDLVLDPTCGSGTTAFVAEQWGRRWITCDTSRVALSLARQRLLTATFPYFQLAWPDAGVSGGFTYTSLPHVTLRSIAQNKRLDEATTQEQRESVIREDAEHEVLYDRPVVERLRVRVSGPFTVEAIPVPAMAAAEESQIEAYPERDGHEGRLDLSASDYIDTLIGLLRKDGVTFPGGKKLALGNLRPVAHGGAIHAEADADDDVRPDVPGTQQRVAISFGPQYGPVTQQQVEQAARSARLYDLLIFAGFAFDSAAQAFIQENPDPKLRMELAHIRPDVQLEDLLKVTANSQLFSVFGQPDIKPKKHKDGNYTVELRGVDVYDPTTGEVHSSDGANVAAWFLDQDYDGRTFGICQAFFPGDKDAWSKLQRALRGSIDEERFEAMRGTVSLPFPAGEYRTIAVKVIDFRGNEVIRIMHLDDVR